MHPYKSLDSTAYWATAVAKKGMASSLDLWSPKWSITRESRVSTFGSCFAQHFGRALCKQQFNWVPFEPAPPFLSATSGAKFNYDVFSVRTGSIYTTSMLLQWVRWALDDEPVPEEIWRHGDRYYDPFRPAIEPDGFASAAEVIASRELAIDAFGKAMAQSNVLVFTLGLTECWVNAQLGYEYPICPGTIAGDFDDAQHQFLNHDYMSVRASLSEALQRIWAINPGLQVLLTVSPVPLTATMSGRHVLVATTESKSILRAVAGALAREHQLVDYFPSYEIISSPVFRGAYFEPNLRSVKPEGVENVMACFFGNLNAKFAVDVESPPSGQMADSIGRAPSASDAERDPALEDDVACEEALLEAFAPRGED